MLESYLARRLKGTAQSEQLAIAAAELHGLGQRFSSEGVQTIRSALGRHASPDLSNWLGTLPDGPNTRYLRALLATDRKLDGTIEAWRDYLAQQLAPEPSDLLAFARVLADLQRFAEAELQLRTALASFPDYAFFTRAEKLIALLARETQSATRSARIALLGNTTTGFLVPVLRALCLRDRIRAEFREGNYGSQKQEILDPDGTLAAFRPEIVILPLSWRDIHFPAEDFMNDQAQLWELVRKRFQCHVVQFAADFPLHGPAGRTRPIEALNRELQERAPGFVSIIDTPALQRSIGRQWEDTAQWARYQQHPGTAALPELAEAIMGHIRAVTGLARKVLVTDLDNTLWKGVIGEDGLDGIQAGPGTPEGEAHGELQQYLLALKNRGILLAVCSKNNPEDAALPFEKHPGMALRLQDFAAFLANWDDKAQNIRRIAEQLSLGLDSFVFLDDNPIERSWVASQIPELTVVDPGASIFEYVRNLDREHYFDVLSLSSEDLTRTERYRAEADRHAARSTSDSLDDFLGQLRLKAWAAAIDASNLRRAAQLINKTNQFNATARRYTEAKLQAVADDPNGWTGAFHLTDRFGSYGLIGVLICKPAGYGTWEIDTWLMSCRTLGRQMERFMFDRMVEAAIEREVRCIRGVFRPTAKNKLVEGLFDQFGFAATGTTSDERYYELVVPTQPVRTATHVENAAAELSPSHVG